MPLTPEELAKRLRAVQNAKPENERDLLLIAQADDLQREQKAREKCRAEGEERPIDWDNVKDLVRSPFRFVDLNDKLAYPEEVKHSHNEPLENGLCARLTVDWLIETPLLIGEEGAEEESAPIVPMTLRDEKDYVIPGATLRGMVRAALQTVAFGRLWPVNRHHRFGLRDFEHKLYKEFTTSSEVKAGWLTRNPNPKEGESEFQIMPCKIAFVEITSLFEPIKERQDQENALPIVSDNDTNVDNWSNRNLQDKYNYVGMSCQEVLDFTKTYPFMPDGSDHGKPLLKPGVGVGQVEGVFVFSDKLPGNGNKRFEYVFHEDEETPYPLTIDAFETFKRFHSKSSKNKPKPDGSWKILQKTIKDQKRIPVFYVGDLEKQDERFAMGLTRLFKIPHKFSVASKVTKIKSSNGLSIHDPASGCKGGKFTPDFVENLFGYVYEPKDLGWPENHPEAKSVELKGRVAFGFARPKEKDVFELWPSEQEDPISTIMGTPQASFAPFYLSGCVKDWSHPGARLAGRKRFLPRYPHPVENDAPNKIKEKLEEQVTAAREASRGREPPERVKSRLRFLVPKAGQEDRAIFQSEIRLHNVTMAELGAILWVLGLGGNHKTHRHMLGRAKPFGAGQVKLAGIDARVKLNKKDQTLPQGDLLQNGGPYLEAFEKHMESQVGENWKKSEQVQGYLRACNPAVWAAQENRLGYPAFPADFQALRKATAWQAGERDPQGPTGPWLSALRDVYDT